jgi:4-amino-4-deoxy-L-arabinose transferase-like glycosyltransferase
MRPAAQHAADAAPVQHAPWRDGLAYVGLAALLRILFLVATRRDPAFRIPYLDEAFYHLWARSLAAGSGDFQGPYFLGPLYPHFVALLYRIAAPDPFVVRAVQCGFGVACVALAWSAARALFGRTAAIAAALLMAFCGPLVFSENVLLLESLLTTATLAALWVLLVPRASALRRGLAASALLGIATLARATAAWLLPVVLVASWRAITAGNDRRAAARAATRRQEALRSVQPPRPRNAAGR